MTRRFSLIDETELDDFESACKQRSVSSKDFELTEMEDPVPTGGISPNTGTVTVRAKATDISQTYVAGHNSSWVAAFALDLQNGVFNI
jgi:hypothetical protein